MALHLVQAGPLRAAQLARVSRRSWRDWPGMLWSVVLDTLGHQLGYWRGYRKIVQASEHGTSQHSHS